MRRLDIVHIEAHATARVVAIVMTLPIFIIGILFYVQATLAGQDYSLNMVILTYELETKGNALEYISVLGVLAAASLLKGIFLYIFAMISINFYNMIASKFGGISIYTSDRS